MNIDIAKREKEIVLSFTGTVTERAGVPPEHFTSSSTTDDILTLVTSRGQEILIGNTKGDSGFSNVSVSVVNENLVFTVNGTDYIAGVNKGEGGDICVAVQVEDNGYIYAILTSDGLTLNRVYAGYLNYKMLEIGDTFITKSMILEDDDSYKNLRFGDYILDKLDYPDAHAIFGDQNSDLFTVKQATYNNFNIYMRVR